MAKVGRPTEYTPSMVEKAGYYVTEYQEQGDVIPSVVGLSIYLGLSRACINRWGTEEDKKEFKDILDNINAVQQQVLLNKGLSGDFNSAITKLVLGKHGYSEKKELTGAEGKDLIPTSITTNYE